MLFVAVINKDVIKNTLRRKDILLHTVVFLTDAAAEKNT
jgi:hypothetical protein